MIVEEVYLSEAPQFTQACKMGRLVIGFHLEWSQYFKWSHNSNFTNEAFTNKWDFFERKKFDFI